MARRRKNNSTSKPAVPTGQSTLAPAADERLDISMLETWLWDAACAIRGATDAPKFKDFILPLIFFKRLSDVFDDEFALHAQEYGDEALAREIIEADLDRALKTGSAPIIRFYIPRDKNWKAVRNHGADGRLGEFITDSMREVARLNPDLQGVLDIKDYNERQSGQRTLDDDRLADLVEVMSRHRLGLKNTEPETYWAGPMSTCYASLQRARGSLQESFIRLWSLTHCQIEDLSQDLLCGPKLLGCSVQRIE